MSNLICRQDAIDELDKGAWGVEWDKALAKTMIESLPSAEHHKLNIAEYIHDQYPDVWKHAEKELEVPSAEANLMQDRCKIDASSEQGW